MPDGNRLYFIVEEITEEEIAVDGDRSSADTGGGWGELRRSRVDALKLERQQKRVSIKASALKAQLQDMIGVVNEVFAPDPQSMTNEVSGGLQLNEITLSVQVNAKGELSILGTGGEIGGSGGITMKFVRPKS